MKLTLKQSRFVQFYDGNATQAAGESRVSQRTAYSQGQRLLKNVEIIKAIQARNKEEAMSKIANRQERQEFWTQVMEDEEVDMVIRLRASELLGKSEADFSEKIEVKAEVIPKPYVSTFDLEERIKMMGYADSESKEKPVIQSI